MARPPPPLHLSAAWSGLPDAALGAARAAIEAGGGAVVDARALSDLHLTLTVELDGGELPAVAAALGAAGLRLLDGPPRAPHAGPITLRVAICTPAGTGDRAAVVPAVPG